MTLERFWRTVVVNCEALPREVLPAASEAAGKRILGTFVIVDLAGFGYVVHDTGVDNALIRAPLQDLTILANEGLCAEFLPGFARLLPRNVRPAMLAIRSRTHPIYPQRRPSRDRERPARVRRDLERDEALDREGDRGQGVDHGLRLPRAAARARRRGRAPRAPRRRVHVRGPRRVHEEQRGPVDAGARAPP